MSGLQALRPHALSVCVYVCARMRVFLLGPCLQRLYGCLAASRCLFEDEGVCHS